MLSMTSTEFAGWLAAEVENRGWSFRELGRRAELSSGAVSKVITGASFPGPDFCTGIARALDLPPALVFQKAGLLPPEPEETADLKEALHLFNQLSPERRKYILTTMRALTTGTPAPAPKASR